MLKRGHPNKIALTQGEYNHMNEYIICTYLNGIMYMIQSGICISLFAHMQVDTAKTNKNIDIDPKYTRASLQTCVRMMCEPTC